MKLIKILSIIGIALLVVSCSKEDTPEPPAPSNQAPTFNNDGYTFTVSEDSGSIGQVSATDPDQDNLTYSITGNSGELFEITPNGEVIVKDGMTLDFETLEQHSITISVSDGDKTTETTVSITVADVPEPFPNDKNAFVTTWIMGGIDLEDLTLIMVLDDNYSYDFTINWGDGTIEDITDIEYSISHTYDDPGTYQISIINVFPAIRMGWEYASTQELFSLDQWGTIEWRSFQSAFSGCFNMVYNAIDVPNLRDVTNMSKMFSYAENIYETNFNAWDVSKVTDMSSMFQGIYLFNEDLSNWDVRNVTDMSDMFSEAIEFNSDISEWEVDNVENMSGMFAFATAFNVDIGDWKVGKVTAMSNMFYEAESFDKDLGDWNIGQVTTMSGMFSASGLSTANFDKTLIEWYNSGNFQDGVNLGASGIYQCESADIINTLESDHGWTIDDQGIDPNCPL